VRIEPATYILMANSKAYFRRLKPIEGGLVFSTFVSHLRSKATRIAVVAAVLTIAGAGQALAQPAADPNPGALTFTGGFDVPSLYFFRGIRQEFDAKLTMFPYADVGIALTSGDGTVKGSSINFGVWNSLNTGTSGSDGPTGKIHYEEDFYATLNLAFGGGFGLGTSYTAYSSPNGMFTTVKELSFKVSKSGDIRGFTMNPYGLLAFELGGDESGSADLGTAGEKGTYLELGIGPTFPALDGRISLAVPVKFGFSLSNYYEMSPGDDHKFGFFDIGALATFPLSTVGSQFGSWNIHGGFDYFLLGDTTENLNLKEDGGTKSSQFIAAFGIGISY